MTERTIRTSALDTVPAVLFCRRHVKTGEPLLSTTYVHLYDDVEQAREAYKRLETKPYLFPMGIVDALVK